MVSIETPLYDSLLPLGSVTEWGKQSEGRVLAGNPYPEKVLREWQQKITMLYNTYRECQAASDLIAGNPGDIRVFERDPWKYYNMFKYAEIACIDYQNEKSKITLRTTNSSEINALETTLLEDESKLAHIKSMLRLLRNTNTSKENIKQLESATDIAQKQIQKIKEKINKIRETHKKPSAENLSRNKVLNLKAQNNAAREKAIQKNAEEEDARLRESVKPLVLAIIKERVDGVRKEILKRTPDSIREYWAVNPADVSVASIFSETWRWHYPERRTAAQIDQARWGHHVGLAEKLRTREDIIAKELYDELLKPELEKLNEEIRK